MSYLFFNMSFSHSFSLFTNLSFFLPLSNTITHTHVLAPTPIHTLSFTYSPISCPHVYTTSTPLIYLHCNLCAIIFKIIYHTQKYILHPQIYILLLLFHFSLSSQDMDWLQKESRCLSVTFVAADEYIM